MNKTNHTVKKWKELFTCKVLCITFKDTKDYEKFLVAGPIVSLHFGSPSQHVFTFAMSKSQFQKQILCSLMGWC